MRTIAELSDLTGRSALLTGGAGHIGLAAAEALLELGATIAILDRDLEACQNRASQLSAQPEGRVFPIACDLEDEAATRVAAREGIEALGGLDVLVHCAAYTGSTKRPGWHVAFEEQGAEAVAGAVSVSPTAAFILAQEARKALATKGRGSIILFGSIYGMVGPDMRLYEGTQMSNSAGFAVAKGGILQLTRYLATVLAPDIRTNTITPGGVWRNQPEMFVDRYQTRTPMGRMAREEDFKGAVAYLASDLSAYVTGQNLVVDGGWTAW